MREGLVYLLLNIFSIKKALGTHLKKLIKKEFMNVTTEMLDRREAHCINILSDDKEKKKDIRLFVKASRMININIHEYLVSKIYDLPFDYNLELA